MKKCLKITLKVKLQEGLLENFIQKNAKQFKIEGTAQAINDETVKIIACGNSTNVDNFVDSIYKGYQNLTVSVIEVEPFLKDRDYRGVFRLIE